MTMPDREPAAASFAVAAFVSVQLLWFIVVGAFAWILRDGLGPEAVTTTGAAALGRMSTTFCWGPVCLAFLVMDAIWWFRRQDRGKR